MAAKAGKSRRVFGWEGLQARCFRLGSRCGIGSESIGAEAPPTTARAWIDRASLDAGGSVGGPSGPMLLAQVALSHRIGRHRG
ncbi:DUF6053 domain-containing protein [Lysobacter enzymogenes]|uniref:DUF6053 domain-containing protein n=1 Tax=Lysobacter enzymogenes TaxID=69 RepID=UPI003D18C9D4